MRFLQCVYVFSQPIHSVQVYRGMKLYDECHVLLSKWLMLGILHPNQTEKK